MLARMQEKFRAHRAPEAAGDDVVAHLSPQEGDAVQHLIENEQQQQRDHEQREAGDLVVHALDRVDPAVIGDEHQREHAQEVGRDGDRQDREQQDGIVQPRPRC